MRQVLLLICCLVATQALAQQDAQFTQYMFNKFYWNPATAGLETDYNELTLIHRSQWAGYDPTFNDGKAPTTQNLIYSLPFPVKENTEAQNHWGLGVNVLRDQVGFATNYEVTLGLAYHLNTSKGLLSFGMSSGLYNLLLDGTDLRVVQNPDPVIPVGQKISQTKADINAGIHFNAEKYFVGVGLSGLMKSEFNFTPENDLTSAAQAIHANIMAGYNWDLNQDWMIQPSVLVKYAETDNVSFETTILANYQGTYYGGFGFREDDAISFLIGANLGNSQKFRVGYAFDWVFNGVNAKAQTSHELRVSYRMPSFKIRTPDIIRSPRFKHF